MEHYNLPGLFEKFYLLKKLIELKENYPYIFRDNIEISSFYGSNGGVTNGGRCIGESHNEKEVSEFCKKHNIMPIITMTNLVVEKDEIPDAFAKSIISNFGDDAMYCVGNFHIEKWLESEGISRERFVCTTTRCFSIPQLIRNADSYKRLVLSECYVNDWKAISSIPEAVRNKLDIIVNNACPAHCEKRYEHYIHMSNAILGRAKNFECAHPDYCGDGKFCELIYHSPNVVTLPQIGAYIGLGIDHFKIRGRSNGDADLIETFAYYLVKPEYQLFFRQYFY